MDYRNGKGGGEKSISGHCVVFVFGEKSSMQGRKRHWGTKKISKKKY